MRDDPLDLSPLDPTTDALRWARLIRAINERAGPALAMRANGTGILSQLGRWAWPALAAAAFVGAISGAALRSMTRPGEPASLLAGSIIEAFDVAPPVALWLAEERSPTIADFVLALEEDGR